MRLFKRGDYVFIHHEEVVYQLKTTWDGLVNRTRLYRYLQSILPTLPIVSEFNPFEPNDPPIGTQELWAAGVTYLRSKIAREAESAEQGGATFYDKVYKAERPEIFFKSLPHRIAGHLSAVHIRRDSTWDVPEPELTLFISSLGTIEGFTIGNDMSSRSIEGENPLYLAQAKVYDRSSSLGPCLAVFPDSIPADTKIMLTITRNDDVVFSGQTDIAQIIRPFEELASYLFRETSFENGVMLMTGTGVIPGDEFTLNVGDEVSISIDNIGTLVNSVKYKS